MDIGDASITPFVYLYVFLSVCLSVAALDLFLAHFPRHVRVAAAVERMENFYHSDRLSATTCGYQLIPLWRLGASIIGNRYANDRFPGHSRGAATDQTNWEYRRLWQTDWLPRRTLTPL